MIHSISVALIMQFIVKKLKLKIESLKYALCWALLHDIATWPLSHTGEAAFSKITNTSSNELRKMMILGESKLPSELTLRHQLKKIKVDPIILLELFEKKNSLVDIELKKIWQIIHSPITPDTLDGMLH